jgi:hypothetical protein
MPAIVSWINGRTHSICKFNTAAPCCLKRKKKKIAFYTDWRTCSQYKICSKNIYVRETRNKIKRHYFLLEFVMIM